MTDLPAGRELDAELARVVLSWTLTRNEHGHLFGRPPDGNEAAIPPYSTDIADAWQVVEHLRADGWDLNLSQSAHQRTEPWDCRLFIAEYKRAIGHGSTAPEAICRAALQALTPTEHPHTDPPAIGTEHGAH